MDRTLQEEIVRLVSLGIYTVTASFMAPELRKATMNGVTVTSNGLIFYSANGSVTVDYATQIELTEDGHIIVGERSSFLRYGLLLMHDERSDSVVLEINRTYARLGRKPLMLPSVRRAKAEALAKARAEEKERRLNADLTASVAGKTVKEVRANGIHGITIYFTDGTEYHVGPRNVDPRDYEHLLPLQVNEITLG